MTLEHIPPVRYAIPAAKLPALSVKYHSHCRGVGPSVPMVKGRGYRIVICGEIAVRQYILTVDPRTGRLSVDFRAIASAH